MRDKLVAIKAMKKAYEDRIAEIQKDYEAQAADNPTMKQQLAQELVQYRGRMDGLNLAIGIIEKK